METGVAPWLLTWIKDQPSGRRVGAIISLSMGALVALALLPIFHQSSTAKTADGSPSSISEARRLALSGPNDSMFFGYVNVHEFGAIGDGKTDDTAAFKKAIASAPSGSTIFVPPGTYLITQDISYPASRSISWRGAGFGSVLNFNGSGLILTGGAEGVVKQFTIEALRIQRRGEAGAALALRGSSSVGLSRWALRDLHIASDGGIGVFIKGAWIGTMDNVIVMRSKTGVRIEADRKGGNTSMNAMTITGGEVQGCIDAWLIEAVAGLTMRGHAVEGNVRGITAINTPRAINIDGGYFEHNTAYDVSFEGHAAGYGNSIRDSIFFSPGGGRATRSSVLLNIGKNFVIEDNSFIGYTESAVRVTDTPGTMTTGVVQGNYLSGTPAELSNAGEAFGRDQTAARISTRGRQ